MTKIDNRVEPPARVKLERQQWFATDDPKLLWIMGISGLVLMVLLARSAVEALGLIVIGVGIFALERTVGDWLADALGPFLSKVLFLVGVVLACGVLLSFAAVRDLMWGALQKADDLGFHSVLVEKLEQMPSPAPIQGGGGSGRVSASGAGSQAPAALAEERGPAERPQTRTTPGTRTRSVLRLGGQGTSVVFTVDVIAAGVIVDEGEVEFSIDGRRVATARISGGRAEARVSGVNAGAHRASARFLGSERFSESTAEAAFSR